MSEMRALGCGQCLPNSEHGLGRLCLQRVVERGKRMNALDRMAHRRIDEHENAIEHVAAQREGLGRNQHRFAELVVGDAAGLFV